MEKCLFEQISSKYIRRTIISYLTMRKVLKLFKYSKKHRKLFGITESNYQYYNIFRILKNNKIETINDIIYSPYIQFLPKNSQYEMISNLVLKTGHFINKPIILNIKDILIEFLIKEKNSNKFLINVNSNFFEKKNNINDVIIQEKNNDGDTKYFTELNIIKNNIDIILFNLRFNKIINGKIIKSEILQNVKYLNINFINDYEDYNRIIDISYFKYLEYLSIEEIKNIKIVFSKDQYKNIKILKIYSNLEIEENKFENLTELHTISNNLLQLNFNCLNLTKLYLKYNKYDKINVELIQSFKNLTYLNIVFEEYYNEELLIIQKFLYLVPNLKYFRINFYQFYLGNILDIKYKFEIYFNQKLEFEIYDYCKKKHFPFDTLIQLYLYNIEEINLINSQSEIILSIKENYKCNINKVRIIGGNKEFLVIPIKSYQSLSVLELRINDIIFKEQFPLFTKNSKVQFSKLEYLDLRTNTITIIEELLENFCNIPNIQFLCIINQNIGYYKKRIISECTLLKKLHTLIIGKPSDIHLDSKITTLNMLDNNHEYYNIYPGLKKTTINYCYFSKLDNY